MIYVLIVIAILLFFLVHAVRHFARQFVRWATEDIRYKNARLAQAERHNG